MLVLSRGNRQLQPSGTRSPCPGGHHLCQSTNIGAGNAVRFSASVSTSRSTRRNGRSARSVVAASWTTCTALFSLGPPRRADPATLHAPRRGKVAALFTAKSSSAEGCLCYNCHGRGPQAHPRFQALLENLRVATNCTIEMSWDECWELNTVSWNSVALG